MTLTFTDSAMVQSFGGIPIEALLAVVTVASGGRMTAILADAARDASRQFEKLHIKAALTSMIVAIAH